MAIASGTCGTCPWEISDAGVLTIGAGALAPNTSDFGDHWPWYQYQNNYTSAVFEQGVTLAGSAMYMFLDCNALTTLDASGLDTSRVTNMRGMFLGCWNLTNLDVSGFNTSNVTNMRAMFNRCRSLITVDVSNFDTSRVTEDMSYMFSGCTFWTGCDFPAMCNPTDCESMFKDCTAAEVYLVPSGTATAAFWRNVASQYSGVHYYLDNASAPTSSLAVTRCLQDGTPSDEGTYAKLEVTDEFHDTLIPYAMRNNARTPHVTKDRQAITPAFTNGVAIVSLGNLSIHTFTYSITDKAGQSSATYTQTLPSVAPALDFYHGSTDNGASFGKLATREGIVDSNWDYWEHGERIYPTFIRSSWSTGSDESTLPVTPCFVLDTSTMSFYWCNGQ